MNTEKEELGSILSDMWKDVYGSRPRHFNVNEMTIEEIQSQLDSLQNQINYQHELEQQQKIAEQQAHAERKRLNAYKPNLVFANLKQLMESQS